MRVDPQGRTGFTLKSIVMKTQRVLHINTKPAVLSNKERLMLEREKDYFQDDLEEKQDRERRLLNRVSKNRLIRK